MGSGSSDFLGEDQLDRLQLAARPAAVVKDRARVGWGVGVTQLQSHGVTFLLTTHVHPLLLSSTHKTDKHATM